MLLSMLLAALLGQPASGPIEAAVAAPTRPTLEANLADGLRALPARASLSKAGLVSDDGGGPGGDTPILPAQIGPVGPPALAGGFFAFRSSSEPAVRRASANRARAPPTA